MGGIRHYDAVYRCFVLRMQGAEKEIEGTKCKS